MKKKGLSRKFEVYYHYLIERKLLDDFAIWLKQYEGDLLKTKKELLKFERKSQ